MESPTTSPAPLALYVHWPFCKSKCPYCDFNSHVRDSVDAGAWQRALLSELEVMAAWMPDHQLSSIFFGGGTPSLMPPAIADSLINRAAQHWDVSPTLEITLEANPTSVEMHKLRDFKAAGINRVSLGVQSLRPEALAFLGREHSASEALHAVELAASLFDRFSFDLIYARPDQTCAAWEAELREALTYAGDHLSLYQLTIEPNTAFHHAYFNQQAFALPRDETAAQMYQLTLDVMADAGLPAYEISNHARAGQASRHNLSYWRGESYIGIGPGAHGRVWRNGAWHATHTRKSPERWLERTLADGHGLEEDSVLTASERAEEYVMMGLRLREGIRLDWQGLDAVLDIAARDRLIAQGFLRLEPHRLLATSKGWLLLNSVIAELLS